MRLIDADKLKVYLQEYLGYGHAIPWVDAQPTAYDVNKVVATIDEALIELEDGTNCGTCVFKEVCDDGYDGCTQTIVAVCKDIVRKGGVE